MVPGALVMFCCLIWVLVTQYLGAVLYGPLLLVHILPSVSRLQGFEHFFTQDHVLRLFRQLKILKDTIMSLSHKEHYCLLLAISVKLIVLLWRNLLLRKIVSGLPG